jgi:hypothetical protein
VDELAVTAIAAPVLEVAASIYLLLGRQGKKVPNATVHLDFLISFYNP